MTARGTGVGRKEDRGVRIDRTYQLNTGGNTDFLNMLNRARLKHKKISKTDPVIFEAGTKNVRVVPADYISFLADNKIAYIKPAPRMSGWFRRITFHSSPTTRSPTSTSKAGSLAISLSR